MENVLVSSNWFDQQVFLKVETKETTKYLKTVNKVFLLYV